MGYKDAWSHSYEWIGNIAESVLNANALSDTPNADILFENMLTLS